MEFTNNIIVKGHIQDPKDKSPYVAIISKTKEEWATLPQMISAKNVLYIYSNYRDIQDPETGEIIETLPAVKIGDGVTYVVDLPFNSIPITQDDIDRWNSNSGLEARVDEENHNLIFY